MQQQQQVYVPGQTGPMQPVMGPQIQMAPAGYVAVQPAYNMAQRNIVESYKSRQSVGLGITLVVVGILAILINIIGYAVRDELAPISHGMWCGVMFIITGGFGIGAKRKNHCMIVTFMVLCIISAVFTSSLFAVAVPAAITNSNCYPPCYESYCYRRCVPVAAAMEALLAIFAVTAAIASIWGSAICCRAVCCCGYPANGQMMVASYGNQQVILMQPLQPGAQYPATQLVASPGQPIYGQAAYYQPAIPQQQSWMNPSLQPLQPGPNQEGQSHSAQGYAGAMAPPPYVEGDMEKRQLPRGFDG